MSAPGRHRLTQPRRHPVRATAARLTNRRRREPADDTNPATVTPATGTILEPVVPVSAADIDPRRVPAAIPASTTRAADAVKALHDAHLELPRGLNWNFHDDGAQLQLTTVDGDDGYLRGIVTVYAAALAVQPQESDRAENGFVLLSAAGEWGGVRIGVQAVVSPDVDENLDRIYQAFRAEDDTQAFDPVDDTGPHRLPQGAA